MPSSLHLRLSSPRLQLFLFVLVVSPYFINLGYSSLWDANEAFYAETPREMLESGNYLAPQFNYQPRIQKPPLTYWIVLAFYKLLPVSEFAVRLPGALAAAGVLIFTFAIGRLLFSPVSGILALLILGTTARFFLLARKLPIDILMLFWLTGTAYFLLRSILKDSDSIRSWFPVYLFLAFGFLTKGPIAWVIPLGTYLLWALWSRKLSRLAIQPVWGMLVLAAAVLPWYILIYFSHGWTYIAPFFLKDNLARFTSETFGPARGPFFYFPTYLVDYFPWSALSVMVPIYLWSEYKTRREEFVRRFGFPILWCGFVFFFFTVSKNKQDYYIAPLYPVMSALLAGVLERTLSREDAIEPGRWIQPSRWILFATSILLLGLSLLLAVVMSAIFPELPLILQYVPSAILLLGSFALGLDVIRGDLPRCLSSLGICVWLMLMLVASVYLRTAEIYRPVKQLCKKIEKQIQAADDVGYYKVTAPSMVYYLRRPIFEEFDRDSMVQRFHSSRTVFCILTEQDYDYFVGQRDLVLYVLDRRARLVTQLRLLLDEDHWVGQELLLVSNKPSPEAGSHVQRDNP